MTQTPLLPPQDGCLLLGGVDVVHGSPVFDVKPYVPFCDCLPDAAAPHWVQVTRAMGWAQLGSRATAVPEIQAWI
jgi:tRNA (Thr-GGU) A37 N-methylase